MKTTINTTNGKSNMLRSLALRLYVICLFLAVGSTTIAQPLNRKADTKIIDALNQLPADNVALYNRLMSDIESTGTEGVEMLIALLQRIADSRRLWCVGW